MHSGYELVCRKELRPVLAREAVAMDALFPDDQGSGTLVSRGRLNPLARGLVSSFVNSPAVRFARLLDLTLAKVCVPLVESAK
jgi:hypothetical protein